MLKVGDKKVQMNRKTPEITWAPFLEDYLTAIGQEAEAAMARHMRYFAGVLADALKAIGYYDKPVMALTASAMRRAMSWLEQPDCTRKLSGGTIKKWLMLSKAIINWGVEEGKLPYNQITCVKYRKKVKYERTPNLPPGALAAILLATQDGTYTGQMIRAALKLAVDSGARPSEICTAKLANLNLAEQELLILEADAKTSGGVLGYGDDTTQELAAYLAARAKHPKAKAQAGLWVTVRGRPLSYRHFYRLFTEYAAKAGFPDATPYSMRVFFATTQYAMGTSEEDIQHQLRHRDATQTRHYRRVAESEASAAKFKKVSIVDTMNSGKTGAQTPPEAAAGAEMGPEPKNADGQAPCPLHGAGSPSASPKDPTPSANTDSLKARGSGWVGNSLGAG